MKITEREALVLTAYTGVSFHPQFSVFHKFAEDTLGYPVLTHEFADPALWEKLKNAVKDEFMGMLEFV